MPLTEDERRRLHEIDTATTCADPGLAHALSTGRVGRRRAHAVGTVLVGASALVLVLGAGLRQQYVCLLAWSLFAIGMLLRFNAD